MHSSWNNFTAETLHKEVVHSRLNGPLYAVVWCVRYYVEFFWFVGIRQTTSCERSVQSRKRRRSVWSWETRTMNNARATWLDSFRAGTDSSYSKLIRLVHTCKCLSVESGWTWGSLVTLWHLYSTYSFFICRTWYWLWRAGTWWIKKDEDACVLIVLVPMIEYMYDIILQNFWFY